MDTNTLILLIFIIAAAVALTEDADIQFPVSGIELEFQVGVTKSGGGKAGMNFWVIELGAEGSYASETIQKVKVKLDAPVDRTGAPVKVTRTSSQKP